MKHHIRNFAEINVYSVANTETSEKGGGQET